jgi:hypothetical protein
MRGSAGKRAARPAGLAAQARYLPVRWGYSTVPEQALVIPP